MIILFKIGTIIIDFFKFPPLEGGRGEDFQPQPQPQPQPQLQLQSQPQFALILPLDPPPKGEELQL